MRLKYVQQQQQLWQRTTCDRALPSYCRFPDAVAGRGSGKTTLAVGRICRALFEPTQLANPVYLYALPTIEQSKGVVWGKLKAEIPKHTIVSVNETSRIIRVKAGKHFASVWVTGMERPERTEGKQYAGVVLDECADQDLQQCMKSLLPALSAQSGWLWRIGARKTGGRGGREWNQEIELARSEGRLFEWESTEVLTAEEMAVARGILSDDDFREQYLAQHVMGGSLVYRSFNASTSQSVWQFADGDTSVAWTDPSIYVGCDFNIDPMCWVVARRRNHETCIIDEIVMRDCRTQDAIDELVRRYGRESHYVFLGDAAGRQRHTSTHTTDYLLLQHSGLYCEVLFPQANPAIQDRHSVVNAAFQNANRQRRLFVHPRCKFLIQDLTTLSYLPGSRVPDLRDPNAGHITDALGYLCMHIYPMAAELINRLQVSSSPIILR